METLLNLGLALALGLLVGVERGWQEREAAEGSRLAGIRTFGLISLLGGLWELLGRGSGEFVLGIAFLAFVVLMSAAHVAEARASHDYGVTTLIAALITFALGALSVRGEHAVAATAAVLTTIILSLKPILHRWLRRIEQQELTAALKLLLISVVILPILPDRGYGPWQALNPHALLYRGRASDVDTVMVDGEILYRGKKHLRLDAKKLLKQVKASVEPAAKDSAQSVEAELLGHVALHSGDRVHQDHALVVDRLHLRD